MTMLSRTPTDNDNVEHYLLEFCSALSLSVGVLLNIVILSLISLQLSLLSPYSHSSPPTLTPLPYAHSYPPTLTALSLLSLSFLFYNIISLLFFIFLFYNTISLPFFIFLFYNIISLLFFYLLTVACSLLSFPFLFSQQYLAQNNWSLNSIIFTFLISFGSCSLICAPAPPSYLII